jgi:hypothetical protein
LIPIPNHRLLSAALLFLSIGHIRARARSDDEKKIKREKLSFVRDAVVLLLFFSRVVVVH